MRFAFAFAVAAVIAAPAASEEAKHPDLSGYWSAPFRGYPMPEDLKAKLPADAVVLDDTGAAEFPRGVYGGLKLTQKALDVARDWQPTDEMTIARVCQPQSIMYTVQGPFPFQIIEAPGLLVFKYEYYDQYRLIYTDGRGHLPEDAPHTKMGDSIGHWEGDELVIDTTHLAPSTITNNGLNHSDQAHMVERYRLSADGKALEASQWFEDPEMLENTGARFIRWERGHDYIYPYECDPTFALEYQGANAPAPVGE
ncbi:hypothetical protein [Croceibacterium aestuarii]|uniref:hypothetical protein n=1 Tax=Croceibacterium aestuarii TaxID=3064139 RepID=UPI00272ED2D2|nr:hypothetical protein [Croceibacterium sp. D39]